MVTILKIIKETGEINLVCYLAQHIHNIIIFTYKQYETFINKIFYIPFHTKSSKSIFLKMFCILHLQHISVQIHHISSAPYWIVQLWSVGELSMHWI